VEALAAPDFIVITQMKTKKIILMIALFLLFGCVKEISKENFIEKWESSTTNSAVSWWYAGEDEAYYYLIEKWPSKSNALKVSKTHISLIDMESFPISKKKRINLKTNNIIYQKKL